jgi:hypothetical protein
MTVLNYALNKFLPFSIIIGVSVYGMGLFAVEPWIIFATSIFINNFAFKTGYSVAWCEAKGIDPSDIDFSEQ